MKIYTSYFSALKKLPETIVPISICGRAPEKFYGIQYKILAPKYGFFQEWKKNHDNKFYIREFYKQVLAPLSAKEIYRQLENLSGGMDIVLVCYEKPGDFCHRHLVAAWLSKELGIEVEEYKI